MSRQSLPRLLASLKAENVAEASFHPDGRLASVRFALLHDEEPETDEEPRLTGGARRALEVLRGQRKSIFDENGESS